MAIRIGKQAGETLRSVGSLSTVGLAFVFALVIGAWLGSLLDRWAGTSPLFFILFFFLGLAAGILNVYRTVSGAMSSSSTASSTPSSSTASTTSSTPSSQPPLRFPPSGRGAAAPPGFDDANQSDPGPDSESR